MTSSPLVYIIVLNWNNWRDTIDCVESCRRLTYPNSRLLIVDNGSTDGSEAVLRGRFPDVELIQTGRNLGFTGGNNAGMRYALAKGAGYLILLNNDTVVDKDFAGELVKAAEADRSIGMLCSKIYFHDRPDVLWYAGASFHPWLGWGRHRGYNERDRGQYDQVGETDRPTGCALMATRELCEKIGLLREEYFCYCEDLDWGMRASNAGYKLVYVPSSKVWHRVSKATGGAVTGISLYYFTRNILKCLDENKPLPLPFRQARFCLAVAAALASVFTQDLPKGVGMAQVFRGVSHYVQGRFGELKKSL